MIRKEEVRIIIDEMTQVVWKCSSCGAEQSLDISFEEQAKRLQDTIKFFKCGICGNPYDSALLQAFRAFIVLCEKIKQSRSEVFFCVPLEGNRNED